MTSVDPDFWTPTSVPQPSGGASLTSMWSVAAPLDESRVVGKLDLQPLTTEQQSSSCSVGSFLVTEGGFGASSSSLGAAVPSRATNPSTTDQINEDDITYLVDLQKKLKSVLADPLPAAATTSNFNAINGCSGFSVTSSDKSTVTMPFTAGGSFQLQGAQQNPFQLPPTYNNNNMLPPSYASSGNGNGNSGLLALNNGGAATLSFLPVIVQPNGQVLLLQQGPLGGQAMPPGQPFFGSFNGNFGAVQNFGSNGFSNQNSNAKATSRKQQNHRQGNVNSTASTTQQLLIPQHVMNNDNGANQVGKTAESDAVNDAVGVQQQQHHRDSGNRPNHGTNVHDALAGKCTFHAYRFSARRTIPTTEERNGQDKKMGTDSEQTLPIFVQMFPSELIQNAQCVFQEVLSIVCDSAGGIVERVEPRSETSFIAFVKTSIVWDVITSLRCRVLMDRHGFWYADDWSKFVDMKEYCETVRRLPQQQRHYKTDGLPCMPLVVELSRMVPHDSVTAPPASSLPFDTLLPMNAHHTSTHHNSSGSLSSQQKTDCHNNGGSHRGRRQGSGNHHKNSSSSSANIAPPPPQMPLHLSNLMAQMQFLQPAQQQQQQQFFFAANGGVMTPSSMMMVGGYHADDQRK